MPDLPNDSPLAAEPRSLFTPDAPEPSDQAILDEQRQTRETWELELLISGGVTFGLLQLPAQLNAIFDRFAPHTTRLFGIVLFLGYLYLTAIVYALIATFVINLIGRAYWVGLIGLDSVFPKGPNWENLPVGPIAREVQRRQMKPLDSTIAKTDRFCRIVFSFGFLIALAAVFSILGAGLMLLVGWLASLAGVAPERQTTVALIAMAVLVGPALLATMLDRTLGDRIPRGGRVGRAMAALIRALHVMQLNGAMVPIQATLFSNLRSKGIRFLFTATFFGALVLAFGALLSRLNALELNSHAYFADVSDETLAPASYESMNASGMEIFGPVIQADIVRDPYVRLFVPYQPERHNNAIARLCPRVRRLEDPGIQISVRPPGVADSLTRPVLDCVNRLHAVSLDGEPVPVTYRFHEHAESGLKGFVTYIPVTALDAGEHVLRVGRVPSASWLRTHPDSTPSPSVLRFWK